jgi:hypothetical protein
MLRCNNTALRNHGTDLQANGITFHELLTSTTDHRVLDQVVHIQIHGARHTGALLATTDSSIPATIAIHHSMTILPKPDIQIVRLPEPLPQSMHHLLDTSRSPAFDSRLRPANG